MGLPTYKNRESSKINKGYRTPGLLLVSNPELLVNIFICCTWFIAVNSHLYLSYYLIGVTFKIWGIVITFKLSTA